MRPNRPTALAALTLAGALLLAPPVSAQGLPSGMRPATGHSVLFGIGGVSCGTWLQDAKGTTPARPDWHSQTHWYHVMWVQGFLSGVGWRSHDSTLKNMDLPGIELFITQYCTTWPLKNLAQATIALADELTIP